MDYDVGMPRTRPVTAEELMAMGEGRRELIRGEVVEMTPAGGRHSEIAACFTHFLREFVVRGRLGVVYAQDCGFRLEREPDTVRAPDTAFVRGERLKGIDTTGYVPLAPDLVVEVVSPSDTFREVEEKAAMWLSFGVRLVWVVEPDLRQVMVYRPGAARSVLTVEDTLTGEDVLPGFEAEVAEVVEAT
jgi:Uma2 family endonuclease